jgi:AraC-like DNA-binding protein
MNEPVARPVLDIADKQTMPGVYLVRLMEVASEHGYSHDWMLDQIGARGTDFSAKGAFCSVGQRLRLLNAIRNARPIPALGLRVGRRIMLSDHGIVGYAILSSADLGSALEIIARYHTLSNPTVRFSFYTSTDEVTLVEAPIFPFDNHAARYHLEEMLAAWLPIGTLLLRGAMDFVQIRVPWAMPEYHALYKEAFNCSIRYNQSECSASIPASRLRERISLANEELALLCEQQCDIIAHEQYGPRSIDYKVQRLLLSQPGIFPSFDNVAHELNMSERSLRRRLTAENTSYSQVVETLRTKIASRYLQRTGIPSISIATLLGYSAPANFLRAFKRATGMTPEQFRKMHRDNGGRQSSGLE